MENLMPFEWSVDSPEFEIPEWSNLGYNKIPAPEMSRHFLILGETGSGKTKSAIIPLMKSILNTYVGLKCPSALIIDPKNELYDYIKQDHRVINYNKISIEEKRVIDFFEGERENLNADIVKSKILQLFPQGHDERNIFFLKQLELTLLAFLKIDFIEYNAGGLDHLISFWNNFVEAAQTIRKSFEEYDEEKKVVFRSAEQRNLWYAYEDIKLKCGWSQGNYFLRFLALINNVYALRYLLIYWKTVRPECEITESYQQLNQLFDMGVKGVEGQLAGVIGSVNNVLIKLTDQDLLSKVNFNPFQPPSKLLSIQDVMESGNWFVYAPTGNSEMEDLIARSIKAKFFDYTFKRKDKERPFAYICDEFQRFITNDRQSGEQSYLDRCRAFRVICVLATQSLASLIYTMQSAGFGAELSESSLNILLNNTGNKLFFRNTDLDTIRKLANLIPQPYTNGKPHVISVRPPSTLKPGECYYLLCNGRWGRAKVNI